MASERLTPRLQAIYASRAGLCVVPPMEDGSKQPITGSWKRYQSARPTPEELRAWYAQPLNGVGVITGAVSGNLEGFEFDDADTYRLYHDTAEAMGLGELVERLEAGYLERTPGGGYHWLYRCATIAGNTLLAGRPYLNDEGEPRVKTLVQTRGEGGYLVLAPSGGRVHPSGRSYELLRGGVATIATITAEERHELWQLARVFDERPRDEYRPAAEPSPIDGNRPGDDFNRKADWSEILEPHGWVRVRRRGSITDWRRPGKDHGISATTNIHDSDLLYVFSSSTSFDPEQGYSKWRAWAILNHGGDWVAAARELGKLGYGSKPPILKMGPPAPVEPSDEAGDDGDRPPEPPKLPEIDAGNLDLAQVSRLAWQALERANDPPFLFRYSGVPTRIELSDDEPPVPMTRVLTEDRLRHTLARVADWYKWRSKKERVSALPPVHVVRDMLATPAQPLPTLVSIIEAPTFAPDGSLHDQPGYSAASRAYYAPAAGFAPPAVPARPTAADIARAKILLLDELLGDFPFVDEAEQAHAVALLLLPFVRNLIDGPTPLHLIEKPSPGTCASLLADMLTLPAIGRPAPAMTEGRDEDEWRKRVTAKLTRGVSVVLIDNLRNRLDSAAVASVITSTIWEDRVLGKSENVLIPVRCAWIATGNNPALSSEMTRRTIRIRLNAQTDRPWLRSSFRHPNLRRWADEHRGDLAWSALTLARAWIAAGSPDAAGTSLGMFEDWSRVMGGILATVEIPGFLSNLSQFYDESDSEGAEVRAFLAAWWAKKEAGEISVADLYPIATAPEITLPLGAGAEQAQRTRLGRLLRSLKDRHYQIDDNLTVCVRAAGSRRRAVQWRLDGYSRGDSENNLTPLNPRQEAIFDDPCEVGEVFPLPPYESISGKNDENTLHIERGGKTSQTSQTSHDPEGGPDDDPDF
jgi:hypothetical protein